MLELLLDEDKLSLDLEKNKLMYGEEEIKEVNVRLKDKLKLIKKIGSGKNGITILVKQKLLAQDQILKLYFNSDDYKKDLLESRKNAQSNLREYSARVFDAGIFRIQDHKFLFTIMELGNGILFKDWSVKLIKLFNEHHYSPAKQKNVIQYGINTIAAMVVSFTNYLQANTTHGDMNPKNIIINFSGSDNDILMSPAGNLDLDKLTITFIDAGTSQTEETNEIYGIERDAYWLIDNSRKVLQKLITRKKFQKLFDLKFLNKRVTCSSTVENSNLSRNIAFSLLRMCGLITYILGVPANASLVEDMKDPNMDRRDNPVRILHSILLDKNADYYNFLPTDIFSPKFIQAWKTIDRSIKRPHEFINWGNLIDYMETEKHFSYVGVVKDFLIGKSDIIQQNMGLKDTGIDDVVEQSKSDDNNEFDNPDDDDMDLF